MSKNSIEQSQMARIEGLMAKQKIDREDYYAMLREIYHVDSKKELTFIQANDLIKRMGGEPVPSGSSPAPKVFASMPQIKALRFFSFGPAIRYCPMRPFNIQGEILDGEPLRAELLRLYDLGKELGGAAPIPATIVKYLFENWINPTANQFLLEGGHKALVRDPARLYYESLTRTECQYLISRFMKMGDVLGTQTPIEAPANDFDPSQS